jgi:hypothetical protein
MKKVKKVSKRSKPVASRKKARSVVRRRKPVKKAKAIRGSSPKPFTMPEGVTRMDGRKKARKKTKKHSRRRSHSSAMMGYAGKPKRRRRSRSRSYGFDKKDITAILMTAGGAVVGGIGSSYAVNMIPNVTPKIKAAIPLAAGIALSMTKLSSKPIIKAMALGMMVTGGLALVRQFMPTLPLLAGEDEVSGEALMLPAGEEDQAMLGDPMSGESFGDDEFGGESFGDESFATTADA